MRFRALFSTALVSAVLIQAPAFAQKAPKPTKDIVDTAVGAGQFTTLAQALGAAGLVETLKGKGPFTVFAPTDAAFTKLSASVDLGAVIANKKLLTDILTYHVVAGKVPASSVVKLNGKTAKTVNGATVAIAVSGKKVTLNRNVNVVQTDVMATNGVIHVIDGVLVPPGFTAPTPTTKAPAPAPTTQPTPTTVAATPVTPATPAPVAASLSTGRTIVDVANANGGFKTLLAAVDAAGLTSTLQGPGPFTVLAPTDNAFKVLPTKTIETLLKPENKALLSSILTYHVVSGRVGSTDVVKLQSFPTVNGKSVSVKLQNGRVFLNHALVEIVDIQASNGVIHVIDTVLLP